MFQIFHNKRIVKDTNINRKWRVLFKLVKVLSVPFIHVPVFSEKHGYDSR